jgi:hypothetical protein
MVPFVVKGSVSTYSIYRKCFFEIDCISGRVVCTEFPLHGMYP